jgi:hypothetical protein
VISATQEARIGRIRAQGHPRKNSQDPTSTNKPGVVAHSCNYSYVGGRGRRITVQAPLGKNTKTLSEKKKQRSLGTWLKW